MRLIACANTVILSSAAVLLSGCSWLGYSGGQNAYQSQSASQGARYKNNSTQYSAQNGRRALGRCQITSPTQRIPQGCRPEQVTLALSNPTGGYGQQGQYTSGGYGSHVGDAQVAQAGYAPKSKLKKPRLRGQFGMEIDHSVSGNLFDPNTVNTLVGFSSLPFHPADGARVNTPADGVTYIISNFASTPVSVDGAQISFDDVYTAPLRISAGFEYIVNDHNTVFASAGYTRAEGKKGGSADIVENITGTSQTTFFDGSQDVTAQFNEPLARDAVVAKATFDFSDMERMDVEVGGRHYFNPVFRETFERPLTPFVSASGGAAYYSDITYRQTVQERQLAHALVGVAHPDGDFVDGGTGPVTNVTDSQWVTYGAVKAGLEWQVTPKTALAFEAGLKYEGARDYSNGASGDAIISVPLTIRGSYNF